MRWIQTIGAVAPTIGAAFGGPLGGAAGSIVSKLLGVDNDEAQIEQAVQTASPETLLKLKKAELEFKQDMARLGLDAETLNNQDRNSARNREIKVRDWTPRIIAACVVMAFAAMQAALIYLNIPADNMDLLVRSMGTLDASLGMVLAYYYGSAYQHKKA